MTFVN